MAIPASITDLSDASASNYPQSTDTAGATVYQLPQAISAIIKKQFIAAPDVTVVASGSVTLPSDYAYITIQGTGFTISGFANCYNGRTVTLRFAYAGLTLTHSSGLALPSSTNITTAANDVAIFVNESPGVWRCVSYVTPIAPVTFSLSKMSGIITKTMTDATGMQVISGLGFTPKMIRFTMSRQTASGALVGSGAYDGTNNNSILNLLYNGSSTPPEQYDTITTSTTYCINAYDTPYAEGQRASVTAITSDSFTLSWTKTGSPTGTASILWEAIG